MSFLETAKEFQLRDEPESAEKAYESAFQVEEPGLSLHDYLEAAVLCFVCTDFGYISRKHLPENFTRNAYSKAKAWLDRASQEFGNQPEIRFWQLYFEFIVLGRPPFVEESRRLLESNETSVPYFYLYSYTRDPIFRTKAEALCELNKKGETAMQRYIKSVLTPLLNVGAKSHT